MKRIGELGRLAATSNRSRQRRNALITLMVDAICISETSLLTRATRRNIPEDGILRKKYSLR
jgi:hypothetical protein